MNNKGRVNVTAFPVQLRWVQFILPVFLLLWNHD